MCARQFRCACLHKFRMPYAARTNNVAVCHCMACCMPMLWLDALTFVTVAKQHYEAEGSPHPQQPQPYPFQPTHTPCAPDLTGHGRR
jgi:hypothetical protein